MYVVRECSDNTMLIRKTPIESPKCPLGSEVIPPDIHSKNHGVPRHLGTYLFYFLLYIQFWTRYLAWTK